MGELKPVALSELIHALEWDSDLSDHVNLVDLREGKVICLERAAYDDPAEWREHKEEAGMMMNSDNPEFLVQRAVAEDRGHERFILPPDKFGYHEYEKMSKFIETLTDGNAANQLRLAIRGKGAFRYFKDTLHRLDLTDSWYEYRHTTMKEFVIAWAEKNHVPYTDDA